MNNEIPADTAVARRSRLIGQLVRASTKASTKLAAILSSCEAENPCRSAACPVCGTTFQRTAVGLVDRAIGERSRSIRGRMHALTIVPASGCLGPEDLTVEACRRVHEEIRGALERSNYSPVVGCLEVSFNEDLTGEIAPHCSIHPHLIGLDWPAKAQLLRLRSEFPPSPFVKRLVHWSPLDFDPRGKAYALKSDRVRRESYLDENRPHRKPHRATRRRALRPCQAVSLAVVEHDLGFKGRLLTHGIEEKLIRQHLTAAGWVRDGP